jgi:phospholipase C
MKNLVKDLAKWKRISRGIAALSLALTCYANAAPAETPQAKHVFVVILENEGYSTTFGPNSAAPYLAKTLPRQGQLLTGYYGIGHNSNDNYLAMISGQAPNPQTQGDCQVFSDFESTGVFGPYGQLSGQGCVFPSSVETVADQLALRGYTWHGYMESMPAACSHPALNTVDNTQKATATSEYATRHNPFVYFHSLIDAPSCAANDVPLTALRQDLESEETTPNLSYIVPNLCHDGHDSPCADGEPGGLVSANAWLKQYIPMILNSPAYKKDGVLIVTFDEADFGASGADATACCHELPGPNSPLPGITGPGGGRVGAVVLSPFVKPGSENGTPYNHYSLLKTVETLFSLPYLGYAQPSDVSPFGSDVFSKTGKKWGDQPH